MRYSVWFGLVLLLLAFSLSPAGATPLCVSVSGSTACAYAAKAPDGQVLVRMEFPPEVGWFGFGIGSSMQSADVMLAYPSADGSTINVHQRTASGHFMPTIDSTQALTVLSNATGTFTSASNKTLHVVTFLRPVTPGASGLPTIHAAGQSLIWAGFLGSPPSTSTSLTQHTSYGVSSGNLLDGSMAFAAASNSTTDPDPIVVQSGSGDQTDRLKRAHGILMFLAWVVFAPIAIFVARFLKAALGIWWFRIHLGIFLFGTTVCTYVALGLVYHVVDVGGEGHYSYKANGIHAIFGLLVVILTVPQAFLGFIIDRLWSPSRTSIPWWDKLHWWMGRTVFLLALVNVPFGFALYYRDTSGPARAWPYIGYGVAVAAALAAFVGMQAMTGRAAMKASRQHHVPVARDEAKASLEQGQGRLGSADTVDAGMEGA
ncbi:hypothetical protein HKX48_006826 [Thoreauomyces humboldtii]|nr:hypothetical protein HKX48_006826 [Thoreauomyces humboldtii]